MNHKPLPPSTTRNHLLYPQARMVLYYIFCVFAWSFCIKLEPHQLTIILGLMSTMVFSGNLLPGKPVVTVDQCQRLLGPAALHTCPLASARSQVRVRLGPGGYCRRSGNGGPQTCLPAAHGVALRAGPYDPSSPTRFQDPREEPSLARRTTQDLLGSGLTRLARERRRDQGKPILARFPVM